ncbi:hypothetical protein WDW37_19100 [Bdellovibrionota bacterium FG-1]
MNIKNGILGALASLSVLASVLASVSASVLADDQDQDQDLEVNVGVSSVFVPSGFDSNSDVAVIANGIFPNSCFQWSRAEVSRNPEGVIEVHPMAKVRAGMCLMVLMPYVTEISLGKLERGEHWVRFIGGDGAYLEKKIVIEQ